MRPDGKSEASSTSQIDRRLWFQAALNFADSLNGVHTVQPSDTNISQRLKSATRDNLSFPYSNPRRNSKQEGAC